jgi:hypothetical protein
MKRAAKRPKSPSRAHAKKAVKRPVPVVITPQPSEDAMELHNAIVWALMVFAACSVALLAAQSYGPYDVPRAVPAASRAMSSASSSAKSHSSSSIPAKPKPKPLIKKP